jgi:hypothetical protein
MAMTDDEHSSISSLVEESEETAEIARQLHEFLQNDHKSVERMRAVRTGIGAEVIERPYEPLDSRYHTG